MPKGLKPIKRRLATGEVRTYWYHRATGKALKHDPATAEGMIEVAALDRQAEAVSAVTGHSAGSFAALWDAYRDSPEWRTLKPRTRSDYQAVRDWLGDGAKKAIVKLMTSQDIIRLRDKAEKARGRRFGNYVLQVVRLVLAWGKPRGWRADNPAADVPQIRKPVAERDVNRAWTPAEVEAFAKAAPPQIMVPFALGLFAGMRQGDALSVTWSAYDGLSIRWIASKNGERCMAPVTGTFKAVIDAAKEVRGDAVQIAVNSSGAPWTASGFRASFFKLVRALEAKKLLAPGCTFHGLRHTVATMARESEASEFQVASAIGDRSTAMAAIYGRDADRRGAQSGVLGDVQKRFANIEWKTRMENAPPKGKGRSPK